jgi:hypothetical protein
MPNDLPLVIAEAMAAAFAAAAVVLLLCGWPWRAPRPALVSAGVALGMGVAYYAGCLLVRPLPHWPPREDQDRLLLVLFPAAVAVEVLGALVRRPKAVVWLLRAAVAAGAARVLLHGSVYVTDLTGPGTAQWSSAEQVLTLARLAGGLAAVWALLYVAAGIQPGRAVPLALALTCGGAAVVVMLSGSASGGMLALPLAAGLAGIVAASFALPAGIDLRAALGPGMVGLFAVLVSGHFFGSLTVRHAVLVFAAPLLCLLPVLIRVTRPRLRAFACVALVAVPVAIAMASAYQSFVKDSRSAPGSREATADDYANY